MKVKYILLAVALSLAFFTGDGCAQAQSLLQKQPLQQEQSLQTVLHKAASRTFTRSKVLIEKFTGVACPNCPDGDVKLNAYLGRHPEYDGKVVEIRHNSYYPYDIYFVPMHTEVSGMWKVPGYPEYLIDRCDTYGSRFDDPSSYCQSRGIFENDHNDEVLNRLNKQTNVSISLKGSVYNPSTKTLNVRVSGEVTTSLNDLRITIFLTQDFGSYENTTRAALTNVHGDLIPVADGLYDVEYEYRIEEQYRSQKGVPENMKIVAFVSTFSEDNFLISEVHNCEVASVTSFPNNPPVVKPSCGMPTITFRNRQLNFASSTPDAVYFYSIESNMSADNTTSAIPDYSKVAITVKAYAAAPGYHNSPEVTKTFTLLDLIGDNTDVNGDGTISISDIPALIKMMKK